MASIVRASKDNSCATELCSAFMLSRELLDDVAQSGSTDLPCILFVASRRSSRNKISRRRMEQLRILIQEILEC
jgi:hypothetical protein